MKYHVFIDFDGTITEKDVGYDFFKHFAKGMAEPVVQRYRNGEIGAVECLQKECDIYNEYPAPAREVKDFIRSQKVSAGFREFVDFCQSHDVRLTILSAGFDFYINPILNDLGLSHLDVLSTPTFIKHGRINPEFIHFDEAICPGCANCKGERIKELTVADEFPVFIGDGHSDSHGAEQAKLVFAKSFLAEYLEKHKIEYIYYNDFFDVINEFRRLRKMTD
ncbi:MAG: HAD-IB family phosphatase [candidate division Zixibacteria bacterium]|nr:HAD-IB family phosphatase [candidate division Zixibacteria bacterium]